jgi:hypothetical protein
MSYWPDEINSDEVLSPEDIMHDAGIELEKRTHRLTVSIPESQIDDRVFLAFEVKNREGTIFNLFEVSHRIGQSYPVAIDPPSFTIPDFLQRERYIPGTPGIGNIEAFPVSKSVREAMLGTQGRNVTNEWICATPAEFKSKLTSMFGRDEIKVQIINLLASKRVENIGAAATEQASSTEGGSGSGEEGAVKLRQKRKK